MKTLLWCLPALVALGACVPPPPKIPDLPSGALALRLHVFGATATEANQAFQDAHKNNPSFSTVEQGGDGDVLVGLENDSPMCVPPTGLCSYRVSYRVRDKDGAIVAANTTTITATSDQCAGLCEKAINNVVVKVIADAAAALRGGASEASVVPPATPAPPAKGTKARSAKEPAICSVASGPRLASEDVERRAAQVEVLKRLEIIDQPEYDCLRKAYLGRL